MEDSLRELREIRLRRGLSQADLSAVTGVAEFTISEIESGKRANPRPSTLRKLAQALGVEVTDLYGEVDNPLGQAPPSSIQPPLNGFEDERREALEILFDNLRIHITGTADRWIRAAETGYSFWSEDAAIAFSIEMRDEAAHLYGFVSEALEPALERLFAGTLTVRSEQRKLIQAVEHLNRAVEMATKAADAVAPPREPTDEDWEAAIPILEQMWEEMDEVKQRQLLREAAEELAEESERAAEMWRSRIA
jgi:transcriptional regulator with XRE-family HTH domain